MELSKEEIIRMAREAGVYLTKIGYEFDTDDLCRFAALVAANEKKFWMEQIDVECNEAVLAEREACAKVCEEEHDKSKFGVNGMHCAAAIRAIKFEGDTGFRPVSEMIAEHKQDPKKGAAIEKAKMRKATRAEKIAMSGVYEVPVEQSEQEPVAWVWLEDWLNDGYPEDCFSRVNHQNKTPLYAAPVRTKDLTDDEIMKINVDTASIVPTCDRQFHFARAVIAADREKNK